MAAPIDPSIRPGTPPRTVAVQAPDLCHRCLGTGSILEAMACDRPHVYLPVVCEPCAGTGRTASA
jgi:DnaJ-class molecular chaperone